MAMGKLSVVFDGKPYVIFGGPYRMKDAYQPCAIGVKMAAEIEAQCEIDIPTVDFSLPNKELLSKGIVEALQALKRGNDIYVGCMGGLGRTGVFMGVLVKVCRDYYCDSKGLYEDTPVQYVRKQYNARAVETASQINFVNSFDTREIISAFEKSTGRSSIWGNFKRWVRKYLIKLNLTNVKTLV